MHTIFSFLLSLFLSLRDSSGKPDRVHVLTEDYLLSPAIQEGTQLRACERGSVCVRARASKPQLKQEMGKEQPFCSHVPLCLKKRKEKNF